MSRPKDSLPSANIKHFHDMTPTSNTCAKTPTTTIYINENIELCKKSYGSLQENR